MKTIDDVMLPDERSSAFVRYDPPSGKFVRIQIEDLLEELSRYYIKDSVPEMIKDSFTTAKNIRLYSWYVYTFTPVSDLFALGCLEYAIKAKIGSAFDTRRWGLRRCLEHAVSEKWIKDDGVKEINNMDSSYKAIFEVLGLKYEEPIEIEDPQAYVKRLVDILSEHRNELAHGTPILYPGGYSVLKCVSKLINQIY